MRSYVAYDDDAIYGVGSTADAAIADAEQYGATTLRTAPCTKYMAQKVMRERYSEDEFGLVNGVVVSGRAYNRL